MTPDEKYLAEIEARDKKIAMLVEALEFIAAGKESDEVAELIDREWLSFEAMRNIAKSTLLKLKEMK